MRRDDKIICIEQVQVIAGQPCQFIDLPHGFLRGPDFKMRSRSLACRTSDSQYLNRPVSQILCNLRYFLRCAHDCRSSAVTFQLHAACTQEIPHSRIIWRIHIIIQRHPCLFCQFFIILSLKRQRIDRSISPIIDAHPVQCIIHPLRRDSSGPHIPFRRIVINQLLPCHQAPGICPVIKPGGCFQELVHGYFVPFVRMFRTFHIVCRGRRTVTELHRSGQDTVIFSRSDCIGSLFDCKIPCTACF